MPDLPFDGVPGPVDTAALSVGLVVLLSHHHKVVGVAVGRGQDPPVANDGASAEEETALGQAHLPGDGVGSGLIPTHDPVPVVQVFSAALKK